jgi:hypothetical protein
MPRPIILLTYPGGYQNISHGRVPAHWALYIPSETNPRVGKTFDAIGTPFTGYSHRFRRNYSLDDEPRRFSEVQIVNVDEALVVDTPGDGSPREDQEAKDRLEQEALRVRCPGVSPKPLDPFGVSNVRQIWNERGLKYRSGEKLSILGEGLYWLACRKEAGGCSCTGGS